MIEDNKAFSDYYIVSLADNKLPDDFDDYEEVYTNTFDSSNIANGELKNYKKSDDNGLTETLNDGRVLAEEYTRKNLSDKDRVDATSEERKKLSATDGWANEKADSVVKGTVELKYKIVDGKNDVYGPLYYVVNLTEKVRHFFLPGWFDDMDAPVKAVVLLRPHNEGLITPIEEFERTMVVDNWEYAKKYRGSTGEYAGKWNHYMSGSKSNDEGISYSSGNLYRTESVVVKSVSKDKDSNSQNNKGKATSLNSAGVITNSSEKRSDGQKTDANGGKFYEENEVDSLNIDFQA